MRTRIAISGATGRMGQTLIDALSRDAQAVLVGALVSPNSAALGAKVATSAEDRTDVVMTDRVAQALAHAQIVVDFSCPAATFLCLAECQRRNLPLVIGTTGFSVAEKQRLIEAACQLPMVLAPNFSVGIQLLLHAVTQAARALAPEYDIEIIEMHHRDKIDAPSGTALQLGEAISKTLGRELAQDAVYGRPGHSSGRTASTIGFSAIRAGDIIGEHTVVFASTGERIEFTHKASSRMAFATGALQAAHFLRQHPKPGLYSMKDVLEQRTQHLNP